MELSGHFLFASERWIYMAILLLVKNIDLCFNSFKRFAIEFSSLRNWSGLFPTPDTFAPLRWESPCRGSKSRLLRILNRFYSISSQLVAPAVVLGECVLDSPRASRRTAILLNLSRFYAACPEFRVSFYYLRSSIRREPVDLSWRESQSREDSALPRSEIRDDAAPAAKKRADPARRLTWIVS